MADSDEYECTPALNFEDLEASVAKILKKKQQNETKTTWVDIKVHAWLVEISTVSRFWLACVTA